MNTEQIVALVSSGVQALSIAAYFFMFLKLNKKQAGQTLEQILNNIPNYIQMINTQNPNTTKTQKTNMILGLIKTDCEEAKVKYSQKKTKKAIEEAVNK